MKIWIRTNLKKGDLIEFGEKRKCRSRVLQVGSSFITTGHTLEWLSGGNSSNLKRLIY